MCSTLVFISVINAATKNNFEKEGLFQLAVYSPPRMEVRAGTQSFLEAGAVEETLEERCLLACTSWLSSVYGFNYDLGQLAQQWPRLQWAGASTSITHGETAP